MYVKSVSVKNFRNLVQQNIEFSQGLNVFCGLNAQGKTNCLESIVLSALGKSPRTEKDKELINWNADYALIKTVVNAKSTSAEIAIKLSKNEKKRVSVNGMPLVRIGELLGWLNVIFFSPKEIDVIREGPDERRRFVDVDLCQTDKNYFYTLNRYNKILAQRNNLLKTEANNANLAEMLSIWDRQLAKAGGKLFSKRLEFISKISPFVKEVHDRLTDGKEKIEIAYQSEMQGSTAAEAEEFLTKRLADTVDKQKKLGYTTSGVHRDDVKFSVNGTDIRKFGSQGQQRTAALSLKLAEALLFKETVGEYPVMLFDDVFSEIDSERTKQLLKYTQKMQTIITTTKFGDDFAEGLKFNRYSVSDGVITKE